MDYTYYNRLFEKIGSRLNQKSAEKIEHAYVLHLIKVEPGSKDARKDFWEIFQNYSPVAMESKDIKRILDEGPVADAILMQLLEGRTVDRYAKKVMGDLVSKIYGYGDSEYQ